MLGLTIIDSSPKGLPNWEVESNCEFEQMRIVVISTFLHCCRSGVVQIVADTRAENRLLRPKLAL